MEEVTFFPKEEYDRCFHTWRCVWLGTGVWRRLVR